MLEIITDTREQMPLDFAQVDGVTFRRDTLPIGDYSARIRDSLAKTVFERKSVADLFGSYTNNYENERAKILKAKDMGIRFILAIEATATEIRKGHSYWKDGEAHESKKSGISMIRQLMTITHKYDVPVWFCSGRKEMAWLIVEYFLALERFTEKFDIQPLNTVGLGLAKSVGTFNKSDDKRA